MKNMKKITIIIALKFFLPTMLTEASSKAEKRLYDDLFENYTSDLRPSKDNGKPVDAMFMFGLLQIEELNEKDQQMTAHGWTGILWTDDRFTWNASDYENISRIIVPASKIWLPEITPINSVDDALELAAAMGKNTRVEISNNGLVYWAFILNWNTACDINMSNFPYDSQACEIHYANWMYKEGSLNFSIYSHVMDMGAFIPNNQWALTGYKLWTEIHPNGDDNLPMLKLKFNLKRDPLFFEVSVILPSILVGLLLVPTFILPVDSGERVSLGITVMLSFSVVLLMLTDVTPRSSNIPRITILIFMSMAFGGISIIINVFIINIHHHNPYKPIPQWIRHWILGTLSKLLCCMNYSNMDAVEPLQESNDNVVAFFEKKKMPFKKSMVSSERATDDIIDYLEFFKSTKVTENMIADNKDDWCNVARVLDRLFFWIYLILLIALSFSIIIIKYD